MKCVGEWNDRESILPRKMDESDYLWNERWEEQDKINSVLKREVRKTDHWWDKMRQEWDEIMFRDMRQEILIADETKWDENGTRLFPGRETLSPDVW